MFSNMGYWSISPPAASTMATDTSKKAWAIRYSVIEINYSSSSQSYVSQSSTFSPAFASITFDGLVTFTNNSYQTSAQVTSTVTSQGYQTASQVSSTATSAANTAVSNAAGNYATYDLSNVTTIDGGKIKTGSIDANLLNIGANNASGSSRIVIDGTNNTIKVYNSGVARVVIGNLG
jgi:hypothetical protein